jgi:hypothetical protein
MIIYNVSVHVEDAIHDEWLVWMKTKHLPDVMQTGMFVEYKMAKLLTRQEDETGITYIIQYYAKTMQDYETYVAEYAPALKAETAKRYGDKILAFRTLMEEI